MPVLGCGAEMSKLMAVSDRDIEIIEEVIAERLALGYSQMQAQRQAVSEALALLEEERSAVMKAVDEQLDVAATQEPAVSYSLVDQVGRSADDAKTSAVKAPDRMFRLGDLPRDMREELFNEHATNSNPEATERGFYAKSVPSGLIDIKNLEVDETPVDQLKRYIDAKLKDLPPIVIADGRLIDGQHRIQAARSKGIRQLRYIDVTGLIDTNAGGFVSEINPNAPTALDSGGAPIAQTDTPTRIRAFDTSNSTVVSAFPTDAAMKAHGDYKAAKAGDAKAAARLVGDLVTQANIVQARVAFGKDVIYLPVHAEEVTGMNQIPNAMAAMYAARAGGALDVGMVQSNRVFHTGAKAMERLLTRAQFAGDVTPGAKYVLIDDVTTMGSTLADLAAYVRSNGGQVAGSAVLVNAMRGATMAPSVTVIKQLEGRHGDQISTIFGIEPAALTAAEAGYLIGFKSTDELRNRATTAQQERVARLASKGISEDVGAPVPQTDTPAFKKWFGASKVVDIDGKPLQLYHGTAKAFNKVNMKRGAQGLFWMTSDKAAIEAGEVGAQGKGSIIPLYASIENPAGWKEYEQKTIGELRRDGFDGIVLPDSDGSKTVVIFEPTQVKSSIKNNGDFDGANPDIRFSIVTPPPAAPSKPSKKPEFSWTDPANRLQFAPGDWLFKKLADKAAPLLSMAGMKAASPELKRQIRAMKLEVEQAKELSAKIAKEAQVLSMTDREMVSDLVEKTLAAGTVPPAHAVRLAALISTTMEEQSNELVSLGMLTQETVDRWKGVYLPRFYKSKLSKDLAIDAWADAYRKLVGRAKIMRGIKGGSLKGRGMYETVAPEQIKDYEGLGWELRDPDYVEGESTSAQVWRDYTRDERDNMGEIRDAGFRFVMGYMQTQKDISLGRMFKRMAEDPASSSRLPTGEFTVRVPDTKVKDTGAKVYGAMAGRFVSQDVLSHLTSFDEMQSETLMVYRKALSLWKEGKTVLNPVSHLNNTVSNMTMAHLAGIGYHRGDKYIGAAKDFISGNPMVEEAKSAGLFLGSFNQAELVESMPPELRELARMQESKAALSGRYLMNAATFMLRPAMQKAYEFEDTFFKYLIFKEAKSRGMGNEDAVDYAQKYIFTYDDLPATARKIRDFGIPFFAYTYKAVPALLHSAMAHPVRTGIPAALLYGITAMTYAAMAGEDDEPWDELAKKYLTDPEFRAKAAELKDFDKKHLPVWMRGNTAFGTPKTMRVGFDKVLDLPVFLDISRLIPGGDLFDVTPNAGGIPLPQPLTPSHPLLSITMTMLGNKDMFTGRDLVDTNDTDGEAAKKRLAWMYKQLAPAVAVGNYHFDRAMNTIAQARGESIDLFFDEYTGIGRDGLPTLPEYAVPQTFGVKVRPIDQDKAASMEKAMDNKMLREIDAEIRQLKRLNGNGNLSDAMFEKKLELQIEKKSRLKDGLTVDGDEKK